MTEQSREKSEGGKAAKGAKVFQKDAKAPKRDETAQLREDLAKAKEDAGKYLDMARHLQADFDNFRKRTERESEDFRRFATQGLVEKLLNIADDLERALASAKADDPLAVGVKAVRGNLMKILTEEGLEEIPTDGKFDPNLHEALMVTDGDEDDKIAEVYQKGYRMNGRVLRYAKVRVTRKKEPAKPADVPKDKPEDAPDTQ